MLSLTQMGNNNENPDKNTDLGQSSSFENKDRLKDSFSNLKNELNKLKSQIKEGKEGEKDIQEMNQIIKNIENIIDEEKTLEASTGGEGKISNVKELSLAKQIITWLEKNPGEANQGRAQSALKLLNDIHGQLDSNLIARGAQWIMQKLTKQK